MSIGFLYAKDGLLGQGASFYKCPEEYSSFDEYAHDTAASLAAFKRMYYNLTDEEILEKRKELFISHACKGHDFFPNPHMSSVDDE
jgi:hypothetical protein